MDKGNGMENEWLDVAYINFDKVILHGRVDDLPVDKVLTAEQMEVLSGVNFKHQCELQAVLKGFL